MTLEQLKILKYIVEFGSLKEAAKRLHKTQPALSIAIKKLEAEFGFQMLDRSQYRLALSPEGDIFYREAVNLLNGADHLTSLGKQLAQGNEAVFRICFEFLSPQSLLISTLKDAYKFFPATEFQLKSGSRFASLQEINDGKADLSIGPWFHLFHAQGEYESFTVGEFEIVLAALPELVSHKSDLTFNELCELPSVTISKSEFSFDSDKLSNYRGGRQLKASDIPSLKTLLLGGVGWAVIPKHLIKVELEEGSLIQLNCLDKESNFKGEVRTFRRSDKVHGPVAEHMWQSLKKAAGSKK